MEAIQVIMVADDPLARSWLQQLLERVEGCEVVAQLTATATWPEDVTFYQGEVVLWDLGWEAPASLPDLGDLGLPVVALVADEEMVVALWQAGVLGILGRDVTAATLAVGLQAAVAGMTVMAPAWRAVVGQVGVVEWPWAEVPTLTPREIEVLQLIAQGLTNKAIARALGISDHTVKFHVNAAMGKLHAPSRTVAVVQATRLGLIVI